MRLLLKLKSESSLIPHNFNYPFSSAIYKFLQFGSAEFSEFLHHKGFSVNGKSYKLFTFSLRFNKPTFIKEGIQLKDRSCKLTISSPLVDDFVKNFVIGSFKNGQFEIWIRRDLYIFEIEQMESLPEPELNEKQKFVPLSPLILSTHKIKNGNKQQYYFRYYDDINQIEKVFTHNLINKYSAVYNKEWQGGNLKFRWDTDFIDDYLSRKKKPTVMETIYKPEMAPINLIGNIVPFILEGDPELMKVGYLAGFGEKNSMGFGLGSIVKS